MHSLRIVLPGGEGHLGKLLATHFSSLGHQVTTLTRNPNSSAGSTGQSNLWETAIWDGKSVGAWVEALEGADVLINLAGRSVDCRYNAKNREEILQSRVRSTAVLGEAIQRMHRAPRVWLNMSTATIYRHSYDHAMDEATGEIGGGEPGAPFGWRFSIDVARRWEEAFFSAQTPNTRKIAIRAAMVMSPEAGGIFEVILQLVRIGLGGAWGSGRQYMSWIHEEDFLRAVEYLIQREQIMGAVNLAAPVPLPNHEFMSDLRDAWGIRIGLPAGQWMLAVGAILLRTETELLLKSRRVVPGILQGDGFEFRHPEWPAAARDLVRRWRERSSRENQAGLIRSA
ncbi:MAG: TIGR01777 family oxidoreductase [Candidatus Acidiferrum sp.]